jgi:hypothetical protein
LRKQFRDGFRGRFLDDQRNNDRRVEVDGHRSSSRISRTISAARFGGLVQSPTSAANLFAGKDLVD